jgi:hypothetical protein
MLVEKLNDWIQGIKQRNIRVEINYLLCPRIENLAEHSTLHSCAKLHDVVRKNPAIEIWNIKLVNPNDVIEVFLFKIEDEIVGLLV